MESTKPASTTDRILEWIEAHIEDNSLGLGDPLPKEIEIAEMTNTSRSSVREALHILNGLGITRSRRKGGIRLVREPILLRLRPYLTQEYIAEEIFGHAIEFRSILEWGMGEVIFARSTPAVIEQLRTILNSAADVPLENVRLYDCDRRFHYVLAEAAGNELALLLSQIYTPIYLTQERRYRGATITEHDRDVWLTQHNSLVDALESRNRERFLSELRYHTQWYLRGLEPENSPKPINDTGNTGN